MPLWIASIALAVLPARFLLPDSIRIFIFHLTLCLNSVTAAFAQDYSTIRDRDVTIIS
jgi:hypothetical protein